MAASEVDIANMALGWLGANLIMGLDDESVEARLSKANYQFSRDAVLEDHAWTFAMGRDVLTPKAEETVFGGAQRFTIPPDTIRLIRVNRSQRDNDDLEWQREGNEIIAAEERIYVFSTKRITDPSRFSPAFVVALAQRLAADLAIPLTESKKMQEQHWSLYVQKLNAAAATDGMQGSSQRTTSRRLIGSRSGNFPGSGGVAVGDVI